MRSPFALAFVLAASLLACGRAAPAPAPPVIDPPPPRSLVMEGTTLCAIDGAGVRCSSGWGLVSGEIGPGVTEVATLAGARTIAASSGRLCGADEAGALACVPGRGTELRIAHLAPMHEGVVFADARGSVWRLAEGDPAPAGTPHLRGAVMVGSPYPDWICALSRRGRVACLRDRDLTLAPVELAVTDVVRISSGWPFCVVRRDARLSCERHTLDAEPSLDDFEVVEGLEHVVDVVTGGGSVCARTESGAVHCFDARSAPDTPWRPGPALLDDAIDLAEIGSELHCARRRSGEIVCWGEDFGGLTARRRPTPIAGLTDAVDATLTHRFGCVARRDGQVACWGNVGAAATSEPSPFPLESVTPVTLDVGVIGAVQVVATATLVCARSDAGEIGCRGPDGAGRPAWVPRRRRARRSERR